MFGRKMLTGALGICTMPATTSQKISQTILEGQVNRNLTVTFFLCVSMFMAISASAQSKSPLQGVWKTSEVTTTGPNASTNKAPQPGFVIFTGKYYSIVSVNADKPRPNLPQDINTATAAQLREIWGPFTGQSGTYEIKGSEVTFRVLAAKNPGVMATGNFATDTFKIEGGTLTLVSKANQNGPANNQVTIKLTRVE
jgi:hypothetical protein